VTTKFSTSAADESVTAVTLAVRIHAIGDFVDTRRGGPMRIGVTL